MPADRMATGFERVAVVAKRGEPEAIQTAIELCEWLARRGLTVGFDSRGHEPGAVPSVEVYRPDGAWDLVVVLGGDGTLLSVARAAGGVPVLGVNLGHLGFLTETGRSELYPSLLAVLEGRYRIEERSLFSCLLVPAAGSRADGPTVVRRYEVLNDAVIAKSALARIIELTVDLDGHRIARYRSDGLVLSTPTGSTAYNLAAGGPILWPRLAVAVITPICPHTLTLRPIVVPDSTEIVVTLETEEEEVYLTLDGQEGTQLFHGDRVVLSGSDARARLVRVSDRRFFDTLRGKLRWGA